jgi:hypothetical protein
MCSNDEIVPAIDDIGSPTERPTRNSLALALQVGTQHLEASRPAWAEIGQQMHKLCAMLRLISMLTLDEQKQKVARLWASFFMGDYWTPRALQVVGQQVDESWNAYLMRVEKLSGLVARLTQLSTYTAAGHEVRGEKLLASISRIKVAWSLVANEAEAPAEGGWMGY